MGLELWRVQEKLDRQNFSISLASVLRSGGGGGGGGKKGRISVGLERASGAAAGGVLILALTKALLLRSPPGRDATD